MKKERETDGETKIEGKHVYVIEINKSHRPDLVNSNTL